MAFERPCLVYADRDGTIYDEPELHMLSMDASGFALPRPEDLTPLPDHCPVVLLPGRHALGLDTTTGEVTVHEEIALAALVPENYVTTGLPAAHIEETSPDLPLRPYAAVGFAHNKFYICARKIDDNSRSGFSRVATKRIKKSGNAIKTLYPKNRIIKHLVDECALQNNCREAQNFCLGLPEMFLPAHPAPLCPNACASSQQACLAFEPTANELAEAMLHHAQSATDPIISFGAICGEQGLDHTEVMLEAFNLFKQQGGEATTILHVAEGSRSPLESLSKVGLSGICSTISGYAHDAPQLNPTDETNSFTPYSHFETARELGLRCMVRYKYFPGISDTENELEKLISLLQQYAIGHLILNNLPNDPQRFCQNLGHLDNGPVVGFGNFLKRIKKQCPAIPIVSAIPSVANS